MLNDLNVGLVAIGLVVRLLEKEGKSVVLAACAFCSGALVGQLLLLVEPPLL